MELVNAEKSVTVISKMTKIRKELGILGGAKFYVPMPDVEILVMEDDYVKQGEVIAELVRHAMAGWEFRNELDFLVKNLQKKIMRDMKLKPQEKN